jgi:hypothetical protein
MADVVTLLRAAPVKIVGGLAEPGTEPEISRSRIVFNGEEESGYETFALFRRVGGHGFCKTGFSEIHKYDLLVKAVLIAADDRAPTVGGSLPTASISNGPRRKRSPRRF